MISQMIYFKDTPYTPPVRSFTKYGKVPCLYHYLRMWIEIIQYRVGVILYTLRGMWPRLKCGCWVECSGHDAYEVYGRSAIEGLTATQVVEMQRQAQMDAQLWIDPKKTLCKWADDIMLKSLSKYLVDPGKVIEMDNLDNLDDFDKLELDKYVKKEDMN